MKWYPFDIAYERGMAVGQSDMKNDAAVFRYKDEVYSLPIIVARAHMKDAIDPYYLWEMPIEKLRELAKEKSD